MLLDSDLILHDSVSCLPFSTAATQKKLECYTPRMQICSPRKSTCSRNSIITETSYSKRSSKLQKPYGVVKQISFPPHYQRNSLYIKNRACLQFANDATIWNPMICRRKQQLMESQHYHRYKHHYISDSSIISDNQSISTKNVKLNQARVLRRLRTHPKSRQILRYYLSKKQENIIDSPCNNRDSYSPQNSGLPCFLSKVCNKSSRISKAFLPIKRKAAKLIIRFLGSNSISSEPLEKNNRTPPTLPHRTKTDPNLSKRRYNRKPISKQYLMSSFDFDLERSHVFIYPYTTKCLKKHFFFYREKKLNFEKAVKSRFNSKTVVAVLNSDERNMAHEDTDSQSHICSKKLFTVNEQQNNMINMDSFRYKLVPQETLIRPYVAKMNCCLKQEHRKKNFRKRTLYDKRTRHLLRAGVQESATTPQKNKRFQNVLKNFSMENTNSNRSICSTKDRKRETPHFSNDVLVNRIKKLKDHGIRSLKWDIPLDTFLPEVIRFSKFTSKSRRVSLQVRSLVSPRKSTHGVLRTALRFSKHVRKQCGSVEEKENLTTSDRKPSSVVALQLPGDCITSKKEPDCCMSECDIGDDEETPIALKEIEKKESSAPLRLMLPTRKLDADFASYGYKHVDILSYGSQSRTHVVRSNHDGKLWVAKVIDLARMTLEEVSLARLEAEYLQKLQHPFIVKFKESFGTHCSLVIVTEYCEGGDLFGRLVTGKSFTEDNCCNNCSEDNHEFFQISPNLIVKWLTQVALGLQYMHSQRILHCDLKSSNIFLTADETIKIGDLGIATEMGLKTRTRGTPIYMSPEICSGNAVTDKADSWALGCVLYELVFLKHAISNVQGPHSTSFTAGSNMENVSDGIISQLPDIHEEIRRLGDLAGIKRTPDFNHSSLCLNSKLTVNSDSTLGLSIEYMNQEATPKLNPIFTPPSSACKTQYPHTESEVSGREKPWCLNSREQTSSFTDIDNMSQDTCFQFSNTTDSDYLDDRATTPTFSERLIYKLLAALLQLNPDNRPSLQDVLEILYSAEYMPEEADISEYIEAPSLLINTQESEGSIEPLQKLDYYMNDIGTNISRNQPFIEKEEESTKSPTSRLISFIPPSVVSPQLRAVAQHIHELPYKQQRLIDDRTQHRRR